MTITAKYPGVCNGCGNKIPVGDAIEWNKIDGARHPSCAAIGPKKKSVTPVPVLTKTPNPETVSVPPATVTPERAPAMYHLIFHARPDCIGRVLDEVGAIHAAASAWELLGSALAAAKKAPTGQTWTMVSKIEEAAESIAQDDASTRKLNEKLPPQTVSVEHSPGVATFVLGDDSREVALVRVWVPNERPTVESIILQVQIELSPETKVLAPRLLLALLDEAPAQIGHRLIFHRLSG